MTDYWILAELPSWVPQQLLIQATTIAAVVWLALTVFIVWRRSATNLTPVDLPSVNRKVQPDFLKRDVKGQQAALARADAADKELTERERQRQVALAAKDQPPAVGAVHSSRSWQIMGLIAVSLAIATLATVLIGAFMPDSTIGRYITEKGGLEAFVEHPVGIGLSLVVLALKLILHLGGRTQQQQPATT